MVGGESSLAGRPITGSCALNSLVEPGRCGFVRWRNAGEVQQMWYAAFRVLTDRLRIESLQPFISGAGVSRWRQVPNRSIPIRDSPGIIAAICRLVGVQSWWGLRGGLHRMSKSPCHPAWLRRFTRALS